MQSQKVVSKDGCSLVRRYLYLEPKIWQALEAQARLTNTSVSLIITALANNGKVTSKENTCKLIKESHHQ